MRGPPDYEKASKQHATDGKDIRRATDTDFFASQPSSARIQRALRNGRALAPRRSGLHACVGYNRRDQLDLIGAWLAALSCGELRALLRRCHRLRSLARSAGPRLPCLTIIAPTQPDVCWRGSAHVLRVRARSLSTPMRRSRVRQHRTPWRRRADIVGLEKPARERRVGGDVLRELR